MASSKKSIVIIGRKGSGKSTIANQLLGHNISSSEKQPVSNCEQQIYWTSKNDFEVCILNEAHASTNGYLSSFQKLWSTSSGENYDFYRRNLPEYVSLIIFVFKYGRFTGEEKTAIEQVMNCFDDRVKSISALVITYCEDLTPVARKAVESNFRSNSETQYIASFMEKGIHCVGFPDVTKTKQEFVHVYSADIANCQKILQELVQKSIMTACYSKDEILKPQEDFEERLQYKVICKCALL